jgi:DNA polymerase-3 subunit delta
LAEAASRAYLLWGDDALSRDEVVQSFRARMRSRPGGELNLIEFFAPDVSAAEVIAACDTAPFLSDRRLVVVHHLFGWRPRTSTRRAEADDGKGASQLKAERERLLAYLPELAPQTTLVLVEGNLAPALREQIAGQLPRGRSDVRGFAAPQGSALERWLVARARKHGGELGPRVPGLLREHGPRSLEALDREVAKLVAYAGGEPVGVDALEALLPGAELVVFDLLDALAEGRAGDALSALRRLYDQGQRPEELSPQIIALYRRLLICRLAMAERLDPAEVQRVHGVRLIDKLRAQARGLPGERIEQGLAALLAFDRKLKRSEVEPESGLELLVAELAAIPG